MEDVADRLVELASSAPAGRVADIGGPEVRPLTELGRAWASVRGRAAAGAAGPAAGQVFAGYRAGHNLVPGPPYGGITLEEYLARRPQ